MRIIGEVAGLWRYPVKSMRGEELNAAFMGFAGGHGAVLVEGTLRQGNAIALLD
jgi:hypothetical protein